MSATHSLVSRESTSPEGAQELARGIEGGLSQVASPCAGAALDLPAPATRPTSEPAQQRRCDRILCLGWAVTIVRYRGHEDGHTHLCATCEREDREFRDIVWSAPMPCALGHGAIWTISAPELA